MSYYSDNYPIYSTSIFPNVFPQYKQIEHYVFNLSDIVGKGSFSIVYKAKNLINSICANHFRWNSSSEGHWDQENQQSRSAEGFRPIN